MKVKKVNGRKYLEIEDSKLFVGKATGSYTGRDGKEYTRIKFFLCEGEVNIGSLAKPNKEIILLKYESPQENPLSDLLGGLFGGRR